MVPIVRYTGIAAWAWLIALGLGIIIIPGDPVICNACGQNSNTVIGVISMVLGAGGLTSIFVTSAARQ